MPPFFFYMNYNNINRTKGEFQSFPEMPIPCEIILFTSHYLWTSKLHVYPCHTNYEISGASQHVCGARDHQGHTQLFSMASRVILGGAWNRTGYLVHARHVSPRSQKLKEILECKLDNCLRKLESREPQFCHMVSHYMCLPFRLEYKREE